MVMEKVKVNVLVQTVILLKILGRPLLH